MSLADAVQASDSEQPKEVIKEEEKPAVKTLYLRKHYKDRALYASLMHGPEK